jgi:hypothetical protein
MKSELPVSDADDPFRIAPTSSAGEAMDVDIGFAPKRATLKSDPLFAMGLPRGSGEGSFDGHALSVRLAVQLSVSTLVWTSHPGGSSTACM